MADGFAVSHFLLVQDHGVSTTAADYLERLATSALLLTPVLPLVLVPAVIFPFVTTRAVLFRLLVLLAAWCGAVVLLLRGTTARWRGGIIGLALLAVFGTAAISAFAGAAPWHSWFGDFERMGGVITWLTYVAYYYLLLRFLGRDMWPAFLRVAAMAGAAAAVFAWIEYHGGIGWPGYAARTPTSSTIGNSGLFGSYCAFSAGFGLLAAAQAPARWQRAFYLLLAGMSGSGIWLSQNRASLVGAVAGVLVGGVSYVIFTQRRRRLLPAVLVLVTVAGLGAAAALYFGGRAHEPGAGVAARFFSASVGGAPHRIIQWRAAWRGFLERPVLGWGPENHHRVWSAAFEPAVYGLDPLARWDRTHNMYLEVLATTGIPGAVAMLALWIAIFFTIVRARLRGGLSPPAAATLLGINTAYAVYLVFWFYDFNSALLWIGAAAFATDGASRAERNAAPRSAESGPRIIEDTAGGEPRRWRRLVLIAASSLAAAAILYVHAFETLRAAHVIERISRRPVPPLEAGISQLRTLARTPAPQSLEVFVAISTYLALALEPDSVALPRRPAGAEELRREAVAIGLGQAQRELGRDSGNERVALHAARIALLGSRVYRDPSLYELAIQLGERAVELNPQNVQVRLVLANFFLFGGDRRKAEEQFLAAAQIFPAYIEPRRRAVLSYAGVGAYQDAVRWLRSTHDHGRTMPPRLVTRIVRGANATGSGPEALAALRGHVSLRLGPSGFWGPGVTSSGATVQEEADQAELLAELELAYGSAQNARAAAMAVEHICPRRPCRSLVPLESLPQF